MEPKTQELATQPKIISNASSGTMKLRTNSVVDGLEELAAIYCRGFNPAWVPAWVEALDDLTPETIKAKFIELKRTFEPTAACPFPTPAHLRKLIIPNLVVDQTSEKSWMLLVDVTMDRFDPDGGWRRPNTLDLKIVHVARLCFGREWASILWRASIHERIFMKRDYMTAYNRCEQLDDWALPALPAAKPTQSLPESAGEIIARLKEIK